MLILLCALSSCNNWFDVAPKETYMDEDNLFKQESAFRNAMNGIYTDLRSDDAYGLVLSLGALELMGQTFVPDASYEPIAGFDNTSQTVKDIHEGAWSRLYNVINSCNNLLRIFEKRTEVNFISGSREMMMAELKALRAFLHYELVRLYHPASVRNSDFKGVCWVDGVNTAQELTTNALLAKINDELTKALVDLEKYDPVVTGVSYDRDELLGTSVIARSLKMNYYAALAVKARLCMELATAEAHREAIACADEVIASGFVSFATSKGTDIAFSKEHVFALPSKGMSDKAYNLYMYPGMPVSPVVDISVWRTASPNDLRLSWFDTGFSSIYPKYGEESIAVGLGSEQPIPMIKLGEMYLIAAEASLKLSDRQGAYAYMNEFATKRFRNTTLSESSTIAEFEADILLESQREFLGEGKLFFYYKRNNFSSITKYDGGTLTMDASKYDWAIPQY